MALMRLGMIFFGLGLMKDGFTPLQDVPRLVRAHAMNVHPATAGGRERGGGRPIA